MQTIKMNQEQTVGVHSVELAKEILRSEISILRERAEVAGDEESVFVLELLETSEEHSFFRLEIAIQMSASFAVADAVSEQQWLQRLLSRNASCRESLELLWRTLVGLRFNHAWPWPKRNEVHNRHVPDNLLLLFSSSDVRR